MINVVTMAQVLVPSEGVVVREIEGDTVIVPLLSGIGDSDDELYTVNETGQAILRNLNGNRTLGEVTEILAENFSGEKHEILSDILGFSAEMVRRGILIVKE